MWAMIVPCGGSLTIQHAVARGMGSSAKYDEPKYLRAMCAVHNQAETANALFAQACLRMGWSARRWVADQSLMGDLPVWYQDGWFVLKDNERLPISQREAERKHEMIYGKAKQYDLGQS